MADEEVIEGRVITGGAAQQVTRQDGMVRISLSLLPGVPFPAEGIAFPEPVKVEAGEWVVVEVGQIPGSEAMPAMPPVFMSNAVTLTSAGMPQLPPAGQPVEKVAEA